MVTGTLREIGIVACVKGVIGTAWEDIRLVAWWDVVESRRPGYATEMGFEEVETECTHLSGTRDQGRHILRKGREISNGQGAP